MKKVTTLMFAMLLAFIPMSGNANEATTETVTREAKAVVIIDSYFDSSKISGDVVNICLARVGCELTPNPIAGIANSFNHGTAMADLVRKANPEAKLILIRAASATKNPRTGAVTMAVINGNDFLNSLRWVASSPENVSAVSFSYTISGNMRKVGDCRLSTVGGVNVSIVDPQIRSTVTNLKNAGIPVFAGTGNDSNRKPVAYPACIPDVMSVAAGVGNSFIPSSNRDANTDFVGALPANTFNYTSSIFGVIPQTTSSATASVAGLWSRSMVEGMWVRVSR
jgi:hypothetical protein